MYRSSSSKVFPIIILIVVVVALIAGLVTLGRYMFSSGTGDKEGQTITETANERLLTVTADRSVRMTIRGPIVANENFKSYRLTISPSSREYRVYTGYLEKVDHKESLDNNTQAYEQFVNALNKAAMTKPGKQAQVEDRSLLGICATGHVYEFEILNGETVDNHFWTSDCKGSPGTFGANLSQVMNLFSRQLPNGLVGFTTQQNQLRF